MRIGEVAARAGVNIQTVRYYERRGLMPEPTRTQAGYRQYRPEAADRLRFIRRAQDLGFSLEEIRELLALRVKHTSACEAVEARARDKIGLVQRKIDELERMKRTLQRLAAACRSREKTDDCPILDALEE